MFQGNIPVIDISGGDPEPDPEPDPEAEVQFVSRFTPCAAHNRKRCLCHVNYVPYESWTPKVAGNKRTSPRANR